MSRTTKLLEAVKENLKEDDEKSFSDYQKELDKEKETIKKIDGLSALIDKFKSVYSGYMDTSVYGGDENSKLGKYDDVTLSKISRLAKNLYGDDAVKLVDGCIVLSYSISKGETTPRRERMIDRYFDMAKRVLGSHVELEFDAESWEDKSRFVYIKLD